jgi:hypothetical protein
MKTAKVKEELKHMAVGQRGVTAGAIGLSFQAAGALHPQSARLHAIHMWSRYTYIYIPLPCSSTSSLLLHQTNKV